MTTKTLLIASVSLTFLAGLAVGFGLSGMSKTEKLVPTNSREQAFYQNWQQARLATMSPAANFRSSVDMAAHDYVYSLSEMARAVARGGDQKLVTSITDARTTALAATFDKVLSSRSRDQHLQFWQAYTASVYAYAVAKANNQATETTKAAQNVTANANQLALFYTTEGVKVPLSTLQGSFSRSAAKLMQSIDGAGSGTLVTILDAVERSSMELSNGFDLITGDIVIGNPQSF